MKAMKNFRMFTEDCANVKKKFKIYLHSSRRLQETLESLKEFLKSVF